MTHADAAPYAEAAAPHAEDAAPYAEDVPLIELQHVSKVYDQSKQPVVALQDVSLVIYRGEFVSIMGRSGSGKSTLLNILGLLDRPSHGVYLLEGVDVTTLKDAELARIRRDHFGFIFQSYNLFPELTALENVEVPMIYAGIQSRERRQRARDLLEHVGLGHRLKHRPLEMSGGEQQRVAIARALANSPALLLADEPTGNLPSEQGQQIMETIAYLNELGMTVIVVTHDPGIARWGTRLLALRDGRLVGDESIPAHERYPSRRQKGEEAVHREEVV